MKKNLNKYMLFLIFAILLQACAVGPDFHEPEDQTSSTFRYASNKTDSIINLKVFVPPLLEIKMF